MKSEIYYPQNILQNLAKQFIQKKQEQLSKYKMVVIDTALIVLYHMHEVELEVENLKM